MASLIQPSSTAGELSPETFGRVDLEKYREGLKTCRNGYPTVVGGVQNRPGTELICENKDHTATTVRLPFRFNRDQEYVLEFGNQFMRVIRNGILVTYASGAQQGQIFELVTPWLTADLRALDYAQLNDRVTICHPDYQTREITRYDHDDWRIALYDPTDGPFQTINIDESITVTSSASTGTVTLTASADLFTTANIGQLFYLEQEPFGQPWETNKAVSINDIRRAEGKYFKALAGGTTGTLRPAAESDTWHDGGVDWQYIHSGWGVAKITALTDAQNVTADVTFYIPDDVVTNDTFKWAFGAFGGDQGWPGAISYHKQRLVLGATNGQPQGLWISRVDVFNSFSPSTPLADDDPLTRVLASTTANEIRHLEDLGRSMVIFTSGAEWVFSGNSETGAVTPDSASAIVQTYTGSSNIHPITIQNTILFVAFDQRSVRDIAYAFASDGYEGVDLSVLSRHLAQGKRIVSWAYQRNPQPLVWIVMDDGTMNSLTYLREQNKVGWARHDTAGEFEDVVVITEGGEDRVYLGVKRTINGQTKRVTERMAQREFSDVKDAFFVDCGLSFDGRNTTATTASITLLEGATSWEADETLEIEASADVFLSSMVGDEVEIHFPAASGEVVRVKVLQYFGAKRVRGTAQMEVPADLRKVATTNWAEARKKFDGLTHLGGETVSILADGDAHDQVTLPANGQLILDYAASVIHAGLPFTTDFETLDIAGGADTLLDRRKQVMAVRFITLDTRALMAGPSADKQQAWPQRKFEAPDQPIEMHSGLVTVRVKSNWTNGGRVFVRQAEPLPINILAWIPEFNVGGVNG